jgi:FG-GAP repeat
MPPRCSSHLIVVLVAVAAVLGMIASPVASANLPAGYASQAIDNPQPSINERFGDGLVNAGDVNGDGEDDILVGIDEHAQISGEVYIFSGETGAVIRRIPPPDPDAGGSGDNPDAFGTYVGKIADIGSCPGFAGTTGQDCTLTPAQIDTGDGVPDHLVSAIGVDVDTNGDDFGVSYVIDGATGAVLKRIRMPGADRTAHAANFPTASQGAGFGRTILSPSGQPPCQGFGGLPTRGPAGDATPCFYNAGSAVAIGDLDNGAKPNGPKPDIVIGASDFSEITATNPACEDPDGPDLLTGSCFQAGRFYVYRGEDLAGLGPATPMEAPHYVIKNPVADHDQATVNSRFHRETMGYSVAPVGDLGKCSTETISPGTFCLNTANTTTPDGRPEFIASSHRADTYGIGDSGVAFVIDGPTGRILDIHTPPEPQQSAIFGFSNYNQPALGNAGSSGSFPPSSPTGPDVYHGAMVHSIQYTAQGRGWVINGDFRFGGANHYRIATLDDPTPNKIGNFSTSSAGVGDLALDQRTEIMIGAYGPHAPQVVEDVINDVHIFSPLNDAVLQTIPDPDQQPGSGFGRSLAPLGDLNDDGFLDFVVGAGGFGPGVCSPCPPTGTEPAQGRIYILRSDNTASGGSTGAKAGRQLTIDANRSKVPAGKKFRLRGALDAFANEAACEASQGITIQRGRAGGGGFSDLRDVVTSAAGEFSSLIRVKRSSSYRARVEETGACLGEQSNTEVVRKKKKPKK